MGKKGGSSQAQSSNPKWMDDAGSELWNFAKDIMFKPSTGQSSAAKAPTSGSYASTSAPMSFADKAMRGGPIVNKGIGGTGGYALPTQQGGGASALTSPSMSLANLRTDILAPLDPNIDHAAMRAKTSSGIWGPTYFQPATGYVEDSTEGFGKTFDYQGWDQGQSDKYMNPFIKSVLEQASNELMRTGDIEKLKNSSAMQAAGAFGGSRHGIAEGEINRNTLDTIGRQYQSGLADAYTNAQQMFTSDEGRRFQGYESDRTQFNTEKDRLLQAASALGNLGTQHSNIISQDIDRLLKTGATRMDYAQKQKDAPYTQLERLAAILNGSASKGSISHQQQPNALAQTLGAAGSLAGGIGGLMAASDKNIKDNIVKVGERGGIDVVEFSYKGSDTRYRGVLAQQVETVRPDAVIRRDDGFLAVDYGAIGIPFERLENRYGL